MFNKILRKNKCPGEWQKVKIKSIYKNKGSKKDLNNQRGIFLTSNVQKAFERVILNRQYPNIDQSMSEFQNGGRKKRSSSEHLYITRAIIDYYGYLNIPVTMQFYDLEKCFDRLWLRKCITVLWDSGVRGPKWMAIYLMNKSAEIIIQTPVGETQPIEIQEVVMQGTVKAAVMCARLIDTATENLENVGAGVQYGEVRVTTQMFQDDILQSSTNAETTQRAAIANEVFQDTNRMKFNMGKTQMMCIPHKLGQKQAVRINNQEFSRCTQYRYLGDHLHTKNNLDLNLEKREKQAQIDIIEIIAIAKQMNTPERDVQMKLKLFNTIIYPKVFFNCETWTNIRKTDLQKLNKIVLDGVKRILSLPISTPGMGILAETGILPAEDQIARKKMMFLHRVLSGGQGKLVRLVYTQQKKFGFPKCWTAELTEIQKLYRFEMEDEQIGALSKLSWKTIVNRKIQAKLQEQLNMERVKKGKVCDIQKFEKKNYLDEMSSQSAKLAIRYRLKMNNLDYHFKNNKTDLCCPLCSKDRDDMNHLAVCESYRHMDNRLKLRDLYSSETDDVCRATEAIRERMEYRETQLLTKL